MCSGIRDAKNLAWKLDLVLRGTADDALLDTYQLERLPHARDWTVISLEAGKIPCTLDPEVARERDAKFRSGWLPPMPNFPKIEGGAIDGDGDKVSRALAGQLALQGRVEHGGRIDLFDNLFTPHGFSIVSMAGDPRSVLSAEQLGILSELRTTFTQIGVVGTTESDTVDVDGTYADYFNRHGVQVVINRPDFYVFGAVAQLADLPSLVDRLIARVGAKTPSRLSASPNRAAAPARKVA